MSLLEYGHQRTLPYPVSVGSVRLEYCREEKGR
jgi:hypothetical protein